MNPGSWITAWLMALCSGCLVTDQIDFQAPIDYPPQILEAPDGPPIGEHLKLIKKDYPNGYEFNVRVRDLNVDQELTARVRLVRSSGERLAFEPRVVLRGDKAERELSVPVPINSLEPSKCNRLDLVVSGSFVRVTAGKGEPEAFDGIAPGSNDIARAMWWILEGDSATGDSADTTSCPPRFEIMPVTATAGRGSQ